MANECKDDNSLGNRIKKYVYWGWWYSFIYSLFVIVLYIIRGPKLFEKYEEYGTTLWKVILFYFIAGTFAGVIVGVLKPITKSVLGEWLLYLIVGCFVGLCCGILLLGLPFYWDLPTWVTVGILGLVYGVIGKIAFKMIESVDVDDGTF